MHSATNALRSTWKAIDMLRKPVRTLFALALTAACTSLLAHAQAQSSADDSNLKLNQIQVIGTHNSYHAGIAPNESKLWQAKYAKAFEGLDYKHQPLPEAFARLSSTSTPTPREVSTPIPPAPRWLPPPAFRPIPTSIPMAS